MPSPDTNSTDARFDGYTSTRSWTGLDDGLGHLLVDGAASCVRTADGVFLRVPALATESVDAVVAPLVGQLRARQDDSRDDRWPVGRRRISLSGSGVTAQFVCDALSASGATIVSGDAEPDLTLLIFDGSLPGRLSDVQRPENTYLLAHVDVSIGWVHPVCDPAGSHGPTPSQVLRRLLAASPAHRELTEWDARASPRGGSIPLWAAGVFASEIIRTATGWALGDPSVYRTLRRLSLSDVVSTTHTVLAFDEPGPLSEPSR
ncbi:hypothetical protein [Rhodococcoides kyotonense]|uniref:Uncharacterized protein n=1 Tax=Rhodococcoides kyotonense TaxID=398843 RepID=A0A239H336_9NOCA|nr:hypothetical protein [Rhodococcus kyotonensis]SNS75438.1 hypothetical protein SAMN05421642_10554 [Rhodococcus kyotonensis]